jgi:hypothetical protein
MYIWQMELATLELIVSGPGLQILWDFSTFSCRGSAWSCRYPRLCVIRCHYTAVKVHPITGHQGAHREIRGRVVALDNIYVSNQ